MSLVVPSPPLLPEGSRVLVFYTGVSKKYTLGKLVGVWIFNKVEGGTLLVYMRTLGRSGAKFIQQAFFVS